jgi:hypothetical protein
MGRPLTSSSKTPPVTRWTVPKRLEEFWQYRNETGYPELREQAANVVRRL